MTDLCKNAIAFLQKRFPVATVLNHETQFRNGNGNNTFRIWPMIAQDSHSGMKQRAIAIEDINNKEVLVAVAQSIDQIFRNLDSSIYIKIGNATKPTGHEIDTDQMIFAPKIILYTSNLFIPIADVIQVFSYENILIDVVDESEMHKTLFISYGGPDEHSVAEINRKLKIKGIKTWFFPDDANPGEKLHRIMHEGVNNYDRVLLVCSKQSLTRPGFLNEIERALEREAREGGSEILIPVTLDDHVYGDWAPDRSDIAAQIRSRVILKLESDSDQIDSSISRLAKVLSVKG